MSTDTPAMRRGELVTHVFESAVQLKAVLPAVQLMAKAGEVHRAMPMKIASTLSLLMGLLDELVPPSGGD